ncbi:MAG: hypothetical protein HEP71_00010 [Roseivirga sp.]|nr:hypothetical protein [Roseivirga sp.]
MNNSNKKKSPVKGRSPRWVPAISGLLIVGYLISATEQFKTFFQCLFMGTSVREMVTSLETAFN